MIDFSSISDGSFVGKSLRIALKIIPDKMVLPIFQGRLKGERWIKGSGVNGYWLGSYELEQQRIMERSVKEGDVVFDIGAHVGFLTLLASELVGTKGKVVAFEPLPRNIHFLKKHLVLNKVTNVMLVESAVTDGDGFSKFKEGASSSMGKIGDDGERIVKTVSLDSFMEEYNVPPPQFIKIDVEGLANQVLVGAVHILKSHHPAILLEAKFGGEENNFYQILSSLGYTIKPLGRRSIETAGDFFAYPQ